MPNPIYAWFEGANQGAIEGWGSWPGEDDQEGREGASLVQQFEHEITIPRDPQSGQASGRRVHHPVRCIKRIDKASPKLYQALCQGERFNKVEFKWFRVDPTGAGDTFAGGYVAAEMSGALDALTAAQAGLEAARTMLTLRLEREKA